MSINTVTKIDNLVPVKHMLVSVSDKNGLEDFITGVLRVSPGVRILSTGGTFQTLKKALGDQAEQTSGIQGSCVGRHANYRTSRFALVSTASA